MFPQCCKTGENTFVTIFHPFSFFSSVQESASDLQSLLNHDGAFSFGPLPSTHRLH